MANESKGHLNVVAASIGWFERNPPLYYQMRIAREVPLVTANPDLLNAYDDICVGFLKQGKNKDAIAWIEKKMARLRALDPTIVNRKEDWYRGYANYGTALAHDWFSRGVEQKDKSELQKGRDMIAKAIEINPNAHFGREKYQLLFMEWVLAANSAEGATEQFADSLGDPAEAKNAIRGMIGLIELGGAWESVDAYATLATLTATERKGSLAALPSLRASELLESGHKAIGTFMESREIMIGIWGGTSESDGPEMEQQAFDRQEFKRLRRLADAWQGRRTTFMMGRLREGRHPDTDPRFWDGYIEERMPEVRQPGPWDRSKTRYPLMAASAAGLCCGLSVLASVGIIVIRLRRKRKLQVP